MVYIYIWYIYIPPTFTIQNPSKIVEEIYAKHMDPGTWSDSGVSGDDRGSRCILGKERPFSICYASAGSICMAHWLVGS